MDGSLPFARGSSHGALGAPNPPLRNFPDVLSGLAPLLRVRAELRQCHGLSACGRPSDPASGAGYATFHFVTRGRCVIELVSTHRTILLRSGDGIVLPRGTEHRVGNVRTDSLVPPRIVSGRLIFETSYHHLILPALPETVVMTAAEGAEGAQLCQLMRMITEELDRPRGAVKAIANDLATALMIMVVRAQLEREGAVSGLLGLLAHRQASLAAAAMLENLGRAWKLDELAACAHASRASLVRMFRKQIRQAPLEFLHGLRMEAARRKLTTTPAPLGDIAAAIGYQSESAFSRAFRRRFGVPPGEARHCEWLADGPEAASAPATMPRDTRRPLVSNTLRPSIAA